MSTLSRPARLVSVAAALAVLGSYLPGSAAQAATARPAVRQSPNRTPVSTWLTTSMTNAFGTLGTMGYAGSSSDSRVNAGSHSYTNAALGVMSDKVSSRTLYFTRTPDGVLLDDRVVDSGSLTKTYYYTLDNVCSVIRITDDTGATAGTYAYDPYGAQTTAEPPSAGANPWRYASGYRDVATHYLKFRRATTTPISAGGLSATRLARKLIRTRMRRTAR